MDLTDRTTESLLDEVAAHLEPAGQAALDELRERFRTVDDLFYLPLAVETRIRETFGSGKRTFDSICNRSRFCYKVWRGKYGEFNPEQAVYAEQLILWVLDAAKGLTDEGAKRAKVLYRFNHVVNHEDTDEGFKRRAKTVDVRVDLMQALAT